MNVSKVLAAVLSLSPADRAAIARAIRAVDAGLDLDPASVHASSDAEVRALCGRAAPVGGKIDPVEFEILERHTQILRAAVERVAAMVGTRSSTVQLSGS